MYSYSPIKSLRVKNFRNIGSVDIDFTQCPIVTLLGENESGKTSIIKAFSMCALHDNPREQKDYIRDGTKMLGVEINLEDGTQVVRVKEVNGVNLYRVIRPDGTVWDTDKITDGLPKEVQDVMGLIAEPETGEYLHIRTYEDKLLFVVTPSSTNYKTMYNALKVEQLTRAIKDGSSEVNGLKAQLTTNTNSIMTLQEQLNGIRVFDIQSLVDIRNRIQSQLALLEKVEKVVKLKEKAEALTNELGALKLIEIYGLTEIKDSLALRVASASKTLNNISKLMNCKSVYREVENTPEIQTEPFEKLQLLEKKIKGLKEKMGKASSLSQIAGMSEISEKLIMQIGRVASVGSQLKQLTSKLDTINLQGCSEIPESSLAVLSKTDKVRQKIRELGEKEKQLSEYKGYIEQVENYLKQCGVAVETCPKCGEQVIFDISKV